MPMKWIQKHFQIVLVVLLAIYIGSVLLAIYHEGWPNASRTGQIGDSFGGLLGPIINLVTIIFLFNTFKIERDRNLLEQKNSLIEQDRIKADAFNARIERFHDIIDGFKAQGISKLTVAEALLGGKGKSMLFHGTEAMDIFFSRLVLSKKKLPLDVLPNRTFKQIEIIFSSVENLFENFVQFPPSSEVYRNQVAFNLSILYTFKLADVITASGIIDYAEDQLIDYMKPLQLKFRNIAIKNALLSPNFS